MIYKSFRYSTFLQEDSIDFIRLDVTCTAIAVIFLTENNPALFNFKHVYSILSLENFLFKSELHDTFLKIVIFNF